MTEKEILKLIIEEMEKQAAKLHLRSPRGFGQPYIDKVKRVYGKSEIEYKYGDPDEEESENPTTKVDVSRAFDKEDDDE